MNSIHILAISGSLRALSTNTSLLRAASILAPEGVEISLYDGLADLPHFNPDMEDDPPSTVQKFRSLILNSDGLLFSTPEYAHGVPGTLKNALDWLVGGSEIVHKPVALLNASPRSVIAQGSLTETLRVMSTRIVSEANTTVPLLSSKLDPVEISKNPEMAAIISMSLDRFISEIKSHYRNLQYQL